MEEVTNISIRLRRMRSANTLLYNALILLAILFSPSTSVAEPPSLSREAELDEIVQNLLEIHPNGVHVQSGAEFQSYLADFKRNSDAMDLADYVTGLHKLFSFYEDGHTAVLSINMNAEPYELRLPVLVRAFADGMYVIEAKDEALPLLGGRVVSVSGVPIDDILARYVGDTHGDNAAWAMRWSSFLFASPGWLHGLNVVHGDFTTTINVQVEKSDGVIVSAELIPRIGANTNRQEIPHNPTRIERLQEEGEELNFVSLIGERTVYVSLDRMQDLEDKPFSSFAAEITEALDQEGIERVILDLRRNGGGNNMLPEPLRRVLIKSRLNRRGGLYVLIGPRTFSAAMNFATRLERETDAIFVGEPTGGAPNHFGDARFLTGSVTGIEYLVSTLRWQDSAPFDQRDWLLPDIAAVLEFGDFLRGSDPALEIAIHHSPEAADFAESYEGMPWLRPSQVTGWEYFFEREGQLNSGPVN